MACSGVRQRICDTIVVTIRTTKVTEMAKPPASSKASRPREANDVLLFSRASSTRSDIRSDSNSNHAQQPVSTAADGRAPD